ncbi:glycosyl hydrolases family 38 N-terminal domain-containing protein [Fimicolochytrium jonesii]|uniref:glycosyl hydrolases family 38 N-terminal domain-containing protein n=1 Tax=Fimicolochytrium jonesii TaxID=1396493 RepID=UPI0022FE812C|nr:glycosyl hydrolases family 38 N-terminal domain-containing protein [Fimicolochytrium jonesii]KAI8817665.1 glycosyl hydrolases family 38 N-terminal domain-containing protein [Fimicolochytrium jonesii]
MGQSPRKEGQELLTAPFNTLQKHRDITLSRLQNFIAKCQFDDVNLQAALIKHRDQAAVKLEVSSVSDLQRIPFDQAIKGDFSPAKVGDKFGPTWSTHWFRVTIDIPASFKGEEVELIFDPTCEALVWSTDGEPLMGITGDNNIDRHVEYRLTKNATGKEHIELYIESACNGMFGAGVGGNGSIQPPENDRYFKLATAEIIVRNKVAWELLGDMEVLVAMIKELPKDSQASWDALSTANTIANVASYDDESSLVEAKKISAEFFAKRADVGFPQHVITAIGNCHIDTAWLWPYDETKRKAARSWATQCGLIEEYPEYVFAASQAQQFEWTEQLYPKLFERMKKHAKSDRFIPVGGTWVEMDCNMPSGEAMCRQFLYGQRYFEHKFGERSHVFWLPDTFGYSAQLPQIIHEADLRYFFTQKLSWNNINKFPHTTFNWTGLDGTSVLTHFSPADTYTAQASVRDVIFAVQNNKDKAYSNQSLLLYGNGDGGGGPLRAMLERLRRVRKLQGFPAVVEHGTPNSFYEKLEATSKDLTSWRGELYFELHRGTYTTHALIKKGNRKGELLLRQVEILGALASTTSGTGYTYEKPELDRLWKLLLLNQFHDVLPGSSIGMVYIDALKFYKDIQASGSKLSERAFEHLVKSGGAQIGTTAVNASAVFNPTSWARSGEIVEVDISSGAAAQAHSSFQQLSADKTKGLHIANDIPPYTLAAFDFTKDDHDDWFVPIIVNHSKDEVIVKNKFIEIKFDPLGRIRSFIDTLENRQVIAPGYLANTFKTFEDIPLFWDAWDIEVYHLEKGWDAQAGGEGLVVEEDGPLRVVLRVGLKVGKASKVVQRIIISATSPRVDFETWVDWRENRRVLKVEFPVNIDNDFATYETQFGFIRRPTHYNNSWDLARFEVCAHKFVDYSEHGYGVALLNDSKYGFAVHGNVIRMSVLRAPKAPDADCDIGEHTFRYALYPHKGSFAESNVVQAGYEFNVPLVISPTPVDLASFTPRQFFSIDKPNIVLDTIKIAEGPLSDTAKPALKTLVLRFYEAYGGRGVFKLTTSLPVASAVFCNVLEDSGSSVHTADVAIPLLGSEKTTIFAIGYAPFKIISIKIELE